MDKKTRDERRKAAEMGFAHSCHTTLALLDLCDHYESALHKIVEFDREPQLHAKHADRCSICVAKAALNYNTEAKDE